MPFSRDTLTQKRDTALQDISAAQIVDGLGSLLVAVVFRSILRAIVYAQAGFAYLHDAYLDYIARQGVPWTATDEYLFGWAALKGITQKLPSSWSGAVAFTGIAGTVIPAGTSLARSDGATYTAAADAPVASGTITVTVVADVAGSAGICPSGSALALRLPINGVQSQGVVTGEVAPGTDIEDPEVLRTRMLQAYANPPQGGAQADYVGWALAVPGVTRAWCNPNGMGPGSVVIYTMFDAAESAYGGFPQGSNGVATAEPRGGAKATGDQLTVANYIYPLRPATALVYSVAPIAALQALTIHNAPAAAQALIGTALAALFVAEAAPDGATPVYLDDIEAAIRAAGGGAHAELVSPTADIVAALGHLPVLGAITWT